MTSNPRVHSDVVGYLVRREALELIAQGLDNPTISLRLGLSGKTVRNYVSNIFAKLHVADRARAIVVAREAGFGRS